MRKRLLNGVNMKIAAATSVVIFTLLVSFMGVYAWFTSTRLVDTTGDDFKVLQYGKFSQLTFYPLDSIDRDGEEGAPTDYHFSTDDTGSIIYNWNTNSYSKTGNTDVTLSQYSPFNRNHPYLAIIELNDEYNTTTDDIAISLTTDTIGFLGEIENKKNKYALGVDSPLKITIKDGKVYYPLSSVAEFAYKTFSSDEYEAWIIDEETEENKDTFDLAINDLSKTAEYKFVTPVNTQQTSSFDNDITIYSSTAGKTVKYIAIVIDYYFDAIDSIYSTFLGDTVLEADEYVLRFQCDWEWNIL